MRTAGSTAWRALLPAAVVVLVLAVLVAPANRRWHGTALTRDVDHNGAGLPLTLPLRGTATASRAQFVHPIHVPGWIPWLLAVLVALLAAALVAAVVRALWPAVRDLFRRLRRRPAPMLAGAGLDGDPWSDTEALRERVDEAAAALLADRRTGGDSVIACWLVLEDAAAESGTGRLRWQTPSEFTTALLLHHRADPDACARLLRLYQRARFGHETLTSADTSAAAAALATIARTLGGHGGGAELQRSGAGTGDPG